jgi:hypothetical protein
MLILNEFGKDAKPKQNYISRRDKGYYKEFLITNLSGEMLYAIDHNGSITEIAPIAQFHHVTSVSGVNIQIRVNSDEPNFIQSGNITYENNGIYTEQFISIEYFKQDYVFIKELNLVLTNRNFRDIAKHPNQQTDLQDLLRMNLHNAQEFNNTTTFAVVANDPFNRVHQLYHLINDKTLYVIPVKHIPEQPAFVNIYYKTDLNLHSHIVEKLDFEQILLNDGVVEYKDKKYFIGTTKAKVQVAYDTIKRQEIINLRKDIEQNLKSDYEQKITNQKLELEEHKLKFSNDLLNYQTKIKKLEEEKLQLEIDNAKLNRLLANYKSDMDYSTTQLEYKTKVDKAKYELAKERTSMLSTMGKVAVVVVPIACSVIAFFMRKSFCPV